MPQNPRCVSTPTATYAVVCVPRGTIAKMRGTKPAYYQYMETKTLNQITEKRIHAVLTGSPTPASDIKALWPQLSQEEQYQALSYYGSSKTFWEHVKAESIFCIACDI